MVESLVNLILHSTSERSSARLLIIVSCCQVERSPFIIHEIVEKMPHKTIGAYIDVLARRIPNLAC